MENTELYEKRKLLTKKLMELTELFPNWGFVMYIGEFGEENNRSCWAWSNLQDPVPFIEYMTDKEHWEPATLKEDK